MIYNLLYPYQRKTVDDLKDFDSCGLFFDVGCGKSITSLALYEQKTIQGKCNKLVIVCLCAKLNEWKLDCEKWFPFSKVIVIDGSKKVRKDFITGNFDIAIINFEKTWRNNDLFLVNHNYYIIIDECFDKETEVLTNKGFKYFKELQDDDLIAQFDKETEEIDFVKPTERICNRYKGKMISLKFNKNELLMTPNHVQVIYNNYKKRYEEHYAKDLTFRQDYDLKLSGFGKSKEQLSFLERIYIMVQADGCITHTNKDGYRVRMGLSKPRKIERMLYLLDKTGIEYKEGKFREFENKKWRTSRQFYFTIPKNPKSLKNIFRLEDIGCEKANQIIEELSNWDCYNRTDCIEYDTTNKENADFIRSVCVLANMKTSSITIKRNKKTYKTLYRVYIRKGSLKDGQTIKKSYIDYDDYVYCVKVPKQAIIVKRCDFIWVFGNCHKIKESTTKVGKFMKQLSVLTPYKCILTATPMGNGYIDLYNQLYFLGLLDISLTLFKEKYCNEQLVYFPGMKPFKKIVGYKNTEYLDLLINKYTRYYERKIEDNLVPEEIVIPFELDKHYNKIAKTRVYEDISLDKVSSKRIGLKSLCSGTLMGNALVDESGNLKRLYQLNDYKRKWVKEFLENFNERVVIFYMYDHQREQLYDMITKIKRPCARYCAEFKEEDLFKENNNAVVLVQYKSGSTGIDWLKQSYVAIFYSLPDSYIEFIQSKGRLNRHGQTKKPLYYLLITQGKTSVDYINYMALKNKTDFNDEFFDKNFKDIESE